MNKPNSNDTASASTDSLQFGVKNAILGALGLAALIGGYILLGQGSITAAPLMLVLGYVVLLPAALLS